MAFSQHAVPGKLASTESFKGHSLLCLSSTAYLMLHLSKQARQKFVMCLVQHVCAVKLGPGHLNNFGVLCGAEWCIHVMSQAGCLELRL